MFTPHRYRITVTPVQADGCHCPDRCTIEFEHHCRQDWMSLLEQIQRMPGFSGDQRTALVVGTQLLHDLMRQHHAVQTVQNDLFAPLRPALGLFVRRLNQNTPILPESPLDAGQGCPHPR